MIQGLAVVVDLLVVPLFPLVMIPAVLYVFTSSLKAEFAFNITWWFVVGVNVVLLLADVWMLEVHLYWHLSTGTSRP